MKYQNMGSYAHLTPFLKVIILFFSVILRKKRCKRGQKCKKRVPVVQCNKVVSITYDTLALTFEYFVFARGA